jgi:hypothetical protein
MLGRVILSHIRLALVHAMILALIVLGMRRGMLVLRERFPLGDFVSPGMGRRLMRLRGVLFLIGRHSIDGSGSRFSVIGVLINRYFNIDEIQDHTGLHINQ